MHYIDNVRINSYNIVDFVGFLGGSGMYLYAGQTGIVKWNIRDQDTNELFDPDEISCDVYDPRGALRVRYNDSNLVHHSQGVYSYSFTVPDDIVAGDWYVKLEAVDGDKTTVSYVHFEVREK